MENKSQLPANSLPGAGGRLREEVGRLARAVNPAAWCLSLSLKTDRVCARPITGSLTFTCVVSLCRNGQQLGRIFSLSLLSWSGHRHKRETEAL